MNRRDEQIAELISRRGRLDQELLDSFYARVLEAYRASSIMDRLARVREITDRTPSDFHVHSNQELRRIDHFNDRSYSWEMYCQQLGRSVALGEETYFFETLQEQLPSVEVTPGAGFGGLVESVARLAADGFTPDTLLAPISYMVNLTTKFPAYGLEWDSQEGMSRLRIGAYQLAVHWSSNGRPLHSFVVFDHRAGTWTVKLDPLTGERLTVAIGEQLQPIHGVVWLAESVTKYTVDNPAGFRLFRPDVPPDEGFDEVR